ncbi:MAG TPA: Na+/H+ antiporter [Acidobacteriaceae bacterium]
MSSIRTIELLFLLLLVFIIAFGQLARKISMPYPIVMVVGGLAFGLIPSIPRITLEPDLVFLVVLPPLIYSSAWTTSWRDFRYNIVSILLLAFGLVGFTVAGVALASPHVFPGFDWRLGIVLGAVVAPTDAIAAAAIARKIGMPSRIVEILEGESLINDATGLLALEFGISMVVSRQTPTIAQGVTTLVWLVIGGILIGLVLGKVVCIVERFLDDGPMEITLSLLIPYAAYLSAEAAHASGVLAVVACGLFLARRSTHMFSPTVRLQIWSFWESFTFLLNGLVFVLIGLQLPFILDAIRGMSRANLLFNGAMFSLLLIVLRIVWVFPGAHLAHYIRNHFDHQNEPPASAGATFVVGWTGMRGVVSLAAALSLPTELANGNPFPQRDLILFLTFAVILVTLVLQGVTLTPLVRFLGLQGANGPDCEEQEARRIVLEAAVAHLESMRPDIGGRHMGPHSHEEEDELFEDLMRHYRDRLASLQLADADREQAAIHRRLNELARSAAQVERRTAVDLRNQGRINDHVLRRIERELDLTESRFEAMAQD